MKIDKLLADYQKFTSAIIADLPQQEAQAETRGDNYFSEVRDKYVGWKPSLDQLRDDFQKQNRNVEWLRMFLSENLILSQTEPVCLDQEDHTWYLNAWHYRVSDRDTRMNRGENHFESRGSYDDVWLYQDTIYGFNGKYDRAEQKLLILEYVDKERRKFERLNNKFSAKQSEELKYDRIRISEEVRVAVWRRDQGRCARCGSRENLEYDHIVPVSKGGGNTERNIELLCQDCNRAKGNRIE